MAEKYKSSSFCPDHGEGGVLHPHLIWTWKVSRMSLTAIDNAVADPGLEPGPLC